MTAPAGRPPPGPPTEDLPPDAPATVEDVRGARRWTWVALAWAIAASAIALFALLGDDDEDPAPAPVDNSSRIERLERETGERLDAFEQRIEEAASQEDVQRLQRRLGAAEDEAEQAGTAAGEAREQNEAQADRLEDLEQRVEDLENEENQQGGAGDEAAP